MTYTLHLGDSREVLKTLPENSIDSCVCDPPYEISFMNREWDSTGVCYSIDLWREVFRVLKPGSHLLAFCATRTYHRMVCAIEDAGFEVRDSIHWSYLNGFPKSLDVSKAIDEKLGATRETVGWKESGIDKGSGATVSFAGSNGRGENGLIPVTAPATPEAKQWDGWGTALKPSHEIICLARRPFARTVVENVLANGTGALNIDACRVEFESADDKAAAAAAAQRLCRAPEDQTSWFGGENAAESLAPYLDRMDKGRWPPNFLFVHSADCGVECVAGCPIREYDRQAEDEENKATRVFPRFRFEPEDFAPFIYTPKPARGEKDAGLEGFVEPKSAAEAIGRSDEGATKFPKSAGRSGGVLNHHATIKPVALMEWLTRLVTPPGGTCLDCFMGSGSTGIAVVRQGFNFVGIELMPEYLEIAKRRIELAANAPRGKEFSKLERGPEAAPGQMGLFEARPKESILPAPGADATGPTAPPAPIHLPACSEETTDMKTWTYRCAPGCPMAEAE